jgi:hypothetical protein
MVNDEVKHASAQMLIAGKELLGPVSAIPNRSGRLWTVDRRWWLINIEFQPSSWSVGSYLNVGVQHLWKPLDHRVFEYGSRTQIAGHGAFVEFGGDGLDPIVDRVRALVSSALTTAELWLGRFADDKAHLQWLTRQDLNDAWRALNAGFAHSALGQPRRSAEVFGSIPKALDPAIPWQASLAAECVTLAELAGDPDAFATEQDRRVNQARALLRLAP